MGRLTERAQKPGIPQNFRQTFEKELHVLGLKETFHNATAVAEIIN
jgi:hypothetical protein